MLTIPEVSCSSDLFIKIWDVQNEWKNTKTFPGHEHTVSSVRFLPGDEQVISASRDRTIRIFDIASTYVPSCLLIRTLQANLRSDIWFALSRDIQIGYDALSLRMMDASSRVVPMTRSVHTVRSKLSPTLIQRVDCSYH